MKALQDIPFETVRANLIDGNSTRLLKSFSRRLGYLHANPVAIRMVDQWLAEGGLLANVVNFGSLEMEVFQNIAPVCPEAILATVEGAAPEALSRRASFSRIIRSIAYDPTLFDRCVELLVQFRALDAETSSAGGSDLASLFY